MSKLFSRRTLTIGAFGVITVACLSIGGDIRQYMDGSKTPQEPLAAPPITSSPSTKVQQEISRQLTSADIASLQGQQSVLQRERDDLARKISQLEERIATNKN